MDVRGTELLLDVVKRRLEFLRGFVPQDSPPRGGSLFASIHTLLNSLENDVSDLKDAYSDPETSEASVRKLVRSTQRLDVLHLLASEFKGDVGRKDLPVGLLSLLDALLDHYNIRNADPLVHLDRAPMYSTLPLTSFLGQRYGSQDGAVPQVVVFNLPALDPANMLLSPLMAHEVGHAYIDRAKIMDELFNSSGSDAAVLEMIDSETGVDSSVARDCVVSWANEILCDQLALDAFGPSFLYAAASFMPASAPLVGITHPPPALRIGRMMTHLRRTGWSEFLDRKLADIHQWLASLAEGPITWLVDSTDRQIADLAMRAVDLLDDPLAQVASPNIGIRYSEYSDICDDCKRNMTAGVPCVDLDERDVSIWEVILAAWEVGIGHSGDGVLALSQAVGNRPFNAFVGKCVELVRVSQLWKAGSTC